MTPANAVFRASSFAVDSEEPAYQRIANAIGEGVKDGRLQPGDRLPTHRELARRLDLAVATVSRGYRVAEESGLVTSTVGRGTFVSGMPTLRGESVEPAGSPRLDLSVNGPARGDHEELLRAAMREVAARPDMSSLMSYVADVGREDARQAASQWLALGGIHVAPDQAVICQGGQHAILVAFGALLRAGDVLLTDSITYHGAKSAAKLLGLRLVGVDMDEGGLLPDALDVACSTATPTPTVVYLMPTAHNPTAITMTDERRREIVEVARRHDLYIVEDDPFALLATDDLRPTAIASLAPERTLHLASLSKTLTPGLRWGAVTGPAHLSDRLGALVRATIFNPAPIAVDVASRWITSGTAEKLLDWQRAEMAARFAAAADVFRDCAGVLGMRSAGLHAWLSLSDLWTPTEVVDLASRKGVDICPTAYFYADERRGLDAQSRGVRLCLGNAPDTTRLVEGLRRLSDELGRGPTWSSGVRI